VQRDLNAVGFKSFVRRHVPTRDPAVHANRLKFAKVVVRRGAPYMRSIAFSDEHDVNTNDHSNRLQWARAPCDVCTREQKRVQNTFRKAVWGCIGLGFKSALVLLGKKRKRDDDEPKSFRQNSASYIRQCLSRLHLPEKYVFMQDGATCHTARASIAYMSRKGMRVLENWPPYSPDLNPIENVWAELDRRVANRHPMTQEELERFTVEEWNGLEQSLIDRYVLSFEARLRKCIAKGGECA